MTARQRGFTFIELMVASAAAAVVILAASAFLVKTLSWYDALSSKIEINRHARETYDLLAYGGRSASTGNDSTKNLYSLRGRKAAPASGVRQNYALQYTSNNLTLTPDQFAAMTIHCVSAANPLPDCVSGDKTVQGWVGSDIQFNSASRSVAGLTTEVSFTMVDPFEIQRVKSPGIFATTYQTIFTLNRKENDP